MEWNARIDGVFDFLPKSHTKLTDAKIHLQRLFECLIFDLNTSRLDTEIIQFIDIILSDNDLQTQ